MMKAGTDRKEKLKKLFDYGIDKGNVAHIFLVTGTEIARLQMPNGVGILRCSEIVEDVMEVFYDFIKESEGRTR
ncbi:MAG: hypothetical protein RR685_02510 [Hungatella sp.]